MALESMYIENGTALFEIDRYSLQYAIGTHPIYQRLMKRMKEKDKANDETETFNEVSNDFEISDSTEIINTHEGDYYEAPLKYQTGDIPDIIVTDFSESVETAEVQSVEVDEEPSVVSSNIHTDNDFTENKQLNSKLHINHRDTSQRYTANKELRDTIKEIRISISEDIDTETDEARRRFTALQKQIRKEITCSVKILRTLFENKKIMASCDPKFKSGQKRNGTTSKEERTKNITIHTIPEEIENNHKGESIKIDNKHQQQQQQELTAKQDVFQNIQNQTNNTKNLTEKNQNDELPHEINQTITKDECNFIKDQPEELQNLTENHLYLNYLFNTPEETIDEGNIIEEDHKIIKDGIYEEEDIIKEPDIIREEDINKEEITVKEQVTIKEEDTIKKEDKQKLSLVVDDRLNENEEMIESELSKPKYIEDTQNFLEKDEHEYLLQNVHQKSTKSELILSNKNNCGKENLGIDISTEHELIETNENASIEDNLGENNCVQVNLANNNNNLYTSNHTQDLVELDQKEKNQQTLTNGNDYNENCNINIKDNKDQVVYRKVKENHQEMTNQNSDKKITSRNSNEEPNRYDDLAEQLQQLLKNESKTKTHSDYIEELTEENRIQNLFQEVFLKWDEIESRLLNDIGSTDHIYEEKMFQEMYEKLTEDKSEIQDTMSDRCIRTDSLKKSKFQTGNELSLKRYKSEAQLYDHHDLVLPKRKDNTLISKIYLQLGMVDKKNSSAKSRWDDTRNRGSMRMNRPLIDQEAIKIRRQHQNPAGETRIYLENKRNRRISLGRFHTVQDIHALEKRKIVQNILSKSQFQERKI